MNTNKTKNNFYNDKKHRIIYVLLSPTKKIFYINQCLKTSLKETYRHNFKGRRTSSKDFINEIFPERPCVFILEEIYSTKAEAYNFVLVWIKIFIENNYRCFNNKKLIDLTKHLYFENRRLFNKRKNVNLENILSCNHCIIPIYKNITCVKYPNKNNETEI